MATRWRVGLKVTAIILIAAGIAGLGRWEGDRAVRRELREMRRVLALVGPDLSSPNLSGYRPAETFVCLDYRTSEQEPYGLELCFDASGRLVETVDRRGGDYRVGSLRSQAERSTINVGVGPVLEALRLVAPREFPARVDELPIGRPDVGVIERDRRRP